MNQYNILKLLNKKIKVVKPLSYKQAIYYLKYSKLLITDSGGMQKEAFFAKTQTLTIRNETEWPETIVAKYNRLAGPKGRLTYALVKKYINSKKKRGGVNSKPYGAGKAAKLILKKLKVLQKDM
jgi:UDP-N-acetylglucosamine 2-epimerase